MSFRSVPILRRNVSKLGIASIAALVPLLGISEGARKQLDCQLVTVCDAGGFCESNSGEFVFTMEPLELESAGAGRYTLSYSETEAEMRAESDAGPFLWNVGQERNALIASSESQWLWHQLTFGPAPEATIRFLECSLRQ